MQYFLQPLKALRPLSMRLVTTCLIAFREKEVSCLFYSLNFPSRLVHSLLQRGSNRNFEILNFGIK